MLLPSETLVLIVRSLDSLKAFINSHIFLFAPLIFNSALTNLQLLLHLTWRHVYNLKELVYQHKMPREQYTQSYSHFVPLAVYAEDRDNIKNTN